MTDLSVTIKDKLLTAQFNTTTIHTEVSGTRRDQRRTAQYI